jgi:ribokinase
MQDVITIGSATVDIFMKSDQFHLQPVEDGVMLCEKYGGKIDINDFRISSGGAGTNTAVGFTKMGFRTAPVVEVGKDFFAQMIWDELKREHVDTEFIVTEKGEQTAVSVVLVAEQGGRSAMTHRGASSMLEARDLPWEALLHTRWVHLSNVGGNTELLFTLFDHLRPTLVGLSWNPGQKELELIAQEKIVVEQIVCDVFAVNKDEWEVVKPVQEKLLAHIPLITVSDGKNGGDLYVRGEYQTHFPAEDVKVVQETGAGDAFIVGFVSAHLLGRPPLECCQWGVKNATSVIQHINAKAGLLTKKDFQL